jgi:small subunit ribosomal protein S9
MATTTNNEYIEAVGRRKTAIARVRVYPKNKGGFTVNEKEMAVYFPTRELQLIAEEPFTKALPENKFKVTVKVYGGGIHAQAEAVRHGIARALIDFDAELRKTLKKFHMLKRDPRSKERRKFGLRKARKSKQWSKR